MKSKQLKIVKVINNNIVCAMNERHQERILIGKGIGFQMKREDLVDCSLIEKEYFLKSKNITGKLYALLAQTPEVYLEITNQIVKHAEEVLHKELNENIYLNLVDHLSFAVTRLKNGFNFKNILLWEIVHFYPDEYKVAQYGIGILKEKIGCELPEDEAGTIAMHIVNAEYDTNDMNNTVKMTELIHKILKVIRYQYQMSFDEESVHYVRFITHLKFFASRLFSNKMLENDTFHELVKSSYPDAFDCAQKIAKLVWQDYQIVVPDEELAYLAVYIKRITSTDNT